MDLSCASVPMWLVAGACCVMCLYVYGRRGHSFWREHGVAGPTPIPFLGNVKEMFEGPLGARQAFQTWHIRYGRVYGIYFFQNPVLVISDPDLLKQVLVKNFPACTDRFFVWGGKLQHRIVELTVFFSEGATWRRLRKMVTPNFSSGKLRQLTHHINRTAANLARCLRDEALQSRSPEAKVVFGAYALDVIAGTVFGLELESLSNLNAPFIQHAQSITSVDRTVQLKLILAGLFPMLMPVLKMFNIGYFKYRDIKFFQDNIRAMIAERVLISKRRADFLQLLLETESEAADGSQGDQKLSMEEVAAQGLIFLIGGYDTTSAALQFLFYELARHPEVQDRMVDEILAVCGPDKDPTYDSCQELKYTEAVIEETLRMYPPVHIISRKTTQAIVLNGISLPTNVGIMIPIYNIGRDPEFFPDPDTFNPERFLDNSNSNINPLTFLPFGFGPRQCIAMRLAKMELKIALVHVLRNLRVVAATPEVLEIDDYNGTLAPKIPIKISFQVRS